MKALLVLATVLTASAIAATAALASGSQYGPLDPWLKAAMSGHRTAADARGGNGSPKATPDIFERSVAIREWHEARAQARAVLAQQAQGTTFITDTLGGNGHAPQVGGDNPRAYVNGGASPAVVRAVQDLGNGRTAAPSVIGGSSGSGFSWTDAGVGAATVAGSMLVLVGSGLLLLRRRSGLTA
jgi:hypothetical protein